MHDKPKNIDNISGFHETKMKRRRELHNENTQLSSSKTTAKATLQGLWSKINPSWITEVWSNLTFHTAPCNLAERIKLEPDCYQDRMTVSNRYRLAVKANCQKHDPQIRYIQIHMQKNTEFFIYWTSIQAEQYLHCAWDCSIIGLIMLQARLYTQFEGNNV